MIAGLLSLRVDILAFPLYFWFERCLGAVDDRTNLLSSIKIIWMLQNSFLSCQLSLSTINVPLRKHVYNSKSSISMKALLLLALLFAVLLADSCGGNCPSGKCPTCYCGTTKSMQDIATWCAKHNWNQNCCKCIMSHESSGNANAMNYNSNASTDVGLWQINTVRMVLSRSTGLDVMEERLPATRTPTWHVLSRSMIMLDRAGGPGQPTPLAGADCVE